MYSILVVYESFYPFIEGGGSQRMYQISKGLSDRGYDIDWIGVKCWNGDDDIVHDGIKYIGINLSTERRVSQQERRTLKSALEFSGKLLIKLIKSRKKYQFILTAQTPWIHNIPILFLYKGRVPILLDIWEVWQNYWIDYYGIVVGNIGIVLEKKIIQHTKNIVSISQMGHNKVNELNLANISNYLIPNGVDLKVVNNINKCEIDYDLVYFGRLVPHKNVDYVIKSTKLLKKYFPNIKVVIMGGGQDYSKLKELIDRHGLNSNIELTGKIDNIENAFSIMKSSKLFILPTTSEGGGSIALIEANACGLPVVAIKHPQGIDEKLITDGYNGFWVDELDEVKISEKIKCYLENIDIHYKMRINSIESSKQYSWEFVVDKYEKIIKELT